ncbi:hypothetical protein BGZ89_000640 [Linnemannia elongata]|nr:hypothetical protein BGZ89_000640 [Linnemannia elongata]
MKMRDGLWAAVPGSHGEVWPGSHSQPDAIARPRRRGPTSKAQTACYDYAVKTVLGLVGGSEGRQYKENEGPAPVFALGLSSFDTQTGLPSKYPKLEELFIR